MRMRPAPRRDGMPAQPPIFGDALVVGDNPLADQWHQWFSQQNREVHRIVGIENLDQTLDAVWSDSFTPHLILTTPHDADAKWLTTDVSSLRSRYDDCVSTAYRVCQRWMQTAIDRNQMHQSSLVTNVCGDGQFGFSIDRPLSTDRWSAETGGLAGLTKAMLIEAWMRGFRDTPMLVIDSPSDASPAQIVRGSLREWATPSHDEEVAVRDEARWTTQAVYQPLMVSNDQSVNHDGGGDGDRLGNISPRITPGGTWVVAGGGRGITAHVAFELAKRHQLKLHLLGMAPPPQIDDETRRCADEDLLSLRRKTYARVQAEGGNAVKFWRQFEKAIEIEQTLNRCRRAGIQATYHSVHIDDAEAVDRVIQKIRQIDGPIRGVIQGAGSGQDARFDRKRPEKVRQCLSAKIDGTASLAAATKDDPLDWFVGFGSISGRFGANGHTDYSAANDMMSKMIGRLAAERPPVRCTTFHWHAWGDIGMATKPEAKLALDMIGMEFMPAAEGMTHFLRELEHGGDETEVLITDRRYIRKFYPAQAIASHDADIVASGPMIHPAGGKITAVQLDHDPTKIVTLDPTKDRFLAEHTVGGRPTLPLVMAIEMMLETAAADRRRRNLPSKIVKASNVTAIAALKFINDQASAVVINVVGQAADHSDVELVADLRRADGRLVDAERKHFSAECHFGDHVGPPRFALDWQTDDFDWIPTRFAPPDAPVHHGDSLRCLRGYHVDENGPLPILRGVIVAPSPMEIGGDHRSLAGWETSPATFDAVLYAAGVLVHHVTGSPSLPISIGTLTLGRLPDPGEPLRVQVRSIDGQGRRAELAAVLVGQNDDLILWMDQYTVGRLT